MIAAFLREFVLPILLFLFLRKLLAGVFSSRPKRKSPPVQTGGKLYKDPVCGTFVSSDSAVTLTLNGQTLYFCSRECWDKYHAR